MESLMDLLGKANMTLDSELKERKSRSSENNLPQTWLGGNVFAHTPYKIHLQNDTDCFLTTFVEPFETHGCTEPKNYSTYDGPQVIPYFSCSKFEKKNLYDKTESTWFLEEDYYLKNLKKRKQDFLRIHTNRCFTGKDYEAFYTYMTSIKLENAADYEEDLVVLGDRRAEFYRNTADDLVLETKEYNILSRVALTLGFGQPSVLLLIPAIRLEAKLYGFTLERPDPFVPTKKDFADSYEIANNGTTTIKRTIEISETVTETFSFGFSEKLEICATVSAEVNVGVPLVAEGKTSLELSTTLSFEAHQDWTTAKEKTFKMTYELEVPPHTTAHISAWYEKVENLKIGFTTKVSMTGKAPTINKYNEVLEGAPATGDDIKAYLELSGWSDSKVKSMKTNDFDVEFTLEGEMKATLGLFGQIGVNSEALK